MRSLPARVTVVILAAFLVLLVVGWWLSRPGPEPVAAPADVSELTHRLVVPPDPASGCPGYEAWLPAAPMGEPVVTDGTRSDATVLLPDGAAILVVCLGDRGSPDQIVAGHLAGGTEGLEPVSGPESSSTAFGEAVSWTGRLGTRELTEWYVERDGVVMVVGALRPQADRTTRGLAEAALTTWVWD